jgi:flagellar assembly protein FliH
MTHFKQEKSSLPAGASKNEKDSYMDVKTFQPRSLSGDVVHSYDKTKEQYGKLAATDQGADGRFNLHPAARKSLGIDHEEQRHLEVRINEEVEKRLAELKEQAREEGFALGKSEGQELALQEFQVQTQPVYDRFMNVLSEFENSKQEIFHANEQFLIQLVFQVAKQVTLKEVKADPNYVKNLCALLVEQIGAKDHVKIKIGRDDFNQVETIRDYLKQQFIDLKNIQIDVSDEFVNGGCKVETDLARINASVDTQLQLINKALGEQ